MSLRIDGSRNNYFQNNDRNAQVRPVRRLDPIRIDHYEDAGGNYCCDVFACLRELASCIWVCVREIFFACFPCYDDSNNERVERYLRGVDRLNGININVAQAPLVLRAKSMDEAVTALAQKVPENLQAFENQIQAYANGWDTARGRAIALPRRYLNATDQNAMQKYLAFIRLRRFEYSDYPDAYREHYFGQLTLRAKLFTMELLKLEQTACENPNTTEKRVIVHRMREALKEVAHAAATGCDPRKATVTFQQWKNVSGRVEIYEILLQHIQDAKMAIFIKRVKNSVASDRGVQIDQSAWGVHCYNWIYANFGVEYGLCTKARAAAAAKDGYITNPAVTGMVAELARMKATNQMGFTFGLEFHKEYLYDWLLNALNMDEHPQPYIEALQNYCQEVQDDPSKYAEYVETRTSKQGTSYIFKPKAVEFFMTAKVKELDLAVDWGNELSVSSFVRDRTPMSIEDQLSQQDIDQIDLAHLLRLWQTYVF